MKFNADVSGRTYRLELDRDGERVTASVDGRHYDVEVSEPEPDIFLIKSEGRVFQVFVSPAERPGGPSRLTVGNDQFEVKLTDPRRLRGAKVGDAHSGGAAEIRTAMPGKIVRILSPVGTEVEKGHGVLVVEAMKMQNEMKAPKGGTVKEIRVGEGATVAAGDILAIIE